jgi:chromosome segregation ATPase
MWPKLLELLPHLTRLVPMLERYLNSRQAKDRENEAALTALAETVRGDLGQVTAAHAGLYRQLQALSAQVAELDGEVKLARLAAERSETQARTTDKDLETILVWVKGGVLGIGGMMVVALILLIARR